MPTDRILLKDRLDRVIHDLRISVTAYLKSQGLYSLRDGWIKLHYSKWNALCGPSCRVLLGLRARDRRLPDYVWRHRSIVFNWSTISAQSASSSIICFKKDACEVFQKSALCSAILLGKGLFLFMKFLTPSSVLSSPNWLNNETIEWIGVSIFFSLYQNLVFNRRFRFGDIK